MTDKLKAQLSTYRAPEADAFASGGAKADLEVAVQGTPWIYGHFKGHDRWWKREELPEAVLEGVKKNVLVTEDSLSEARVEYERLQEKLTLTEIHLKASQEKRVSQAQSSAETPPPRGAAPPTPRSNDELSTELRGEIKALQRRNEVLQKQVTALERRLLATEEEKIRLCERLTPAPTPNDSFSERDADSESLRRLQALVAHKDRTIQRLQAQLSARPVTVVPAGPARSSASPPAPARSTEMDQEEGPADDVSQPSRSNPSSESPILSLAALQNKYSMLKEQYQALMSVVQSSNPKEEIDRRIYLRNTLIHFLESDPVGMADHEGLIPVIMRLLMLTPEEIHRIESKRPKPGLLRKFNL